MSKILVTGATGFVGSYLVRYLIEQGQTVRALKRSTSDLSLVAAVQEKIEWVEGDILDIISLEDAMQGIEQVYHCAAIVSFNPKEQERLKKVNVEGTANVVNISLYHNIKKLVHVSSIAAIGRSPYTHDVSEETKWERSKLNTHYAISKFQAEQEVWRGGAEGLNIAIVNPSIIIGSGFWHSGTGRFFEQIWNGLKFYPTGNTGFVDVRDVARAMIRLMNSDISDERFILNGVNMPYQRLLNLIATNLGKPQPSIKVTPLLREVAWRIEWLRSKITGKTPFITRETARNSALSYEYSNEKWLRTFEDFEFTPIETTVQASAHQFLESQKVDKGYNVLELV